MLEQTLTNPKLNTTPLMSQIQSLTTVDEYDALQKQYQSQRLELDFNKFNKMRHQHLANLMHHVLG
jgi:hypothetical protein